MTFGWVILCLLTPWCSFSTLLNDDVWFDSHGNICRRLCLLPGFHLVETQREGSATTNQVVANRKHAIFISEVGLEVCTSHLLIDIARILKNHYNPKALKLLRVSIFLPKIRNLKSQLLISNYGEHLNRALWDQFVCGPNNPKIQNNIERVNTGDLMFKKACSIVETMEIADRNTQEFHPSSRQTIRWSKKVRTLNDNHVLL